MTIVCMLAKYALAAKAQPLEDGLTGSLHRQHLDNHLGHTQLARCLENRLRHLAPKPAPPVFGTDNELHIAYVRRPADQATYRTICHNLAGTIDCYHLPPIFGCIGVDQTIDDVGILQVVFEINQIICRNLLTKPEQRSPIFLRQWANGDL